MLAVPRAFTCLASLTLVSAALAQPAAETRFRTGLPGESLPLARRLDRAAKLAADQQWADAVDEYQRILEEAGDALVPLLDDRASREQSSSPRRCLSARRVCHVCLCALPPEALKVYRARVDSQAKNLLDQAKAQRDPRLLLRIVNEMFCSRPAEQALDQLGDWAFERGDFDEAERWWRLLALPASESTERRARSAERKPAVLVYPDPQMDVALVRAKQLLARFFRGDDPAAIERELMAYRGLHANSAGSLAGHKGQFAAILDDLHGQLAAPAAVPEDEPWTTFAGSAARSHVTPKLPRALRLDDPTWRVRLVEAANKPVPRDQGGESATRRELPGSAFHPVIARGQVIVGNSRLIQTFDLLTGRLTGTYDLAKNLPGAVGNLEIGAPPPLPRDLRYTLTVAGNAIYARLGAVALADPKPENKNNTGSYLVCLGLIPKDGKLLPRWAPVTATKEEKGPAGLFEGAPVVRDSRLYIARTRFAGLQATTSIDCFDADTGEQRWRQDVCDLPESGGGTRYRHHLLTLAGPNVVYCSHSGAIVAVDAVTGARVWGLRYPGRGMHTSEGLPSGRDLAPCVYAAGRLYVAPADYEHILCLDAWTGDILWESSTAEVGQLLGVAEGRLIFTTSTRMRRSLRAVDAVTGRDIWNHEEGDIPFFGRGLFAEAMWENKRRVQLYLPVGPGAVSGRVEYLLHIVDVHHGQLFPEFHSTEPLGNLAYADGCLIVAGPEEMKAYVSEARLLDRRRKEAAVDPHDVLPRYRLALAEAAAGSYSQALERLQQTEELTDSLRPLLRQRRHEVLLELAEKAQRAKRWDEAVQKLRPAAGAEFPVSLRLRALQREATVWLDAGQPGRAAAAWQTILRDPDLRRGQLDDEQGKPQIAGLLAALRIGSLVAKHGTTVYATFETQAKKLLDSAEPDQRGAVIERLATEYPNAAVTATALLQQLQVHQQAGQWSAARDTLLRLARICGEAKIPALDSARTAREFVTRELQRVEYTKEVAPKASTPQLPLARSWRISIPSSARLLLPPNQSSNLFRRELLFFAAGKRLSCREAATGKVCWERSLPWSPSWLDHNADTVIVAGAGGIAGLRALDGVSHWEFLAPQEPVFADDVPFMPEALGAFRLVDSRLSFLQGGRRLLMLDAETGRVLWQQWAPGARLRLPAPQGRFHPKYYAGSDWLMVQASSGKHCVLDSRTGRKVHEDRAETKLWAQPPAAVDERRVCLSVADRINGRQRVVLFDPANGKETWSREIDRWPSLSGEPVEFLVAGDTLVLLVPRNYGYELERLDAATGSRRWPEAKFIGREKIDLRRVGIDRDFVYVASRDLLRAYALADGAKQWQVPLAGRPGERCVICAGDKLAVYDLRIETDPETGKSDFTLRFHDPKDGRLLQRHSHPSAPGLAQVTLFRSGAAIVCPGTACGLAGGAKN